MFHHVEEHIGYWTRILRVHRGGGVRVRAGDAAVLRLLRHGGTADGIIVLFLMPFTAMFILQYGSYFRATSHGKVFGNVTSAVTARSLDYTLTASQFCLGFVMMAGAGSNLHQQFGLPLWGGSVIMAVLVLAASMLDVEKITNLFGAITPFMLLPIFIAAIAAIVSGPGISATCRNMRSRPSTSHCPIGG